MANRIIERTKKFIHFLRYDLWHIEVESSSRLHRFGVEGLRVTHLVLKGVKEDHCQLHAAALTFATLMALVPFLVILFSISSAIGFTVAKQWLMEQAGELGIEELTTFITNLINMVEQVDMGKLGAFGGVIFLYIVYKLLSGVEESFNQIWGVRASRGMADKARNYLAVLFCVPVLMITATYVSAKLTGLTTAFIWIGPYIQMVLQLAPVAIMMTAFMAVFMFLPNTKVGFKPAMVGAFVSALISLIFQKLMIYAGIGVTRMGHIYGAFAYVPIFLFWLQTSWMILLFGSELAFAMQNRQTYQEERRAVRASALSRLWVAFAVMKEAIRVFNSEEPYLDLVAFSRSANKPIRLVNEVAMLLASADFIGAIAVESPGCYVLLQPPEHISAKQIYDLMTGVGASPEALGLSDPAIDELFALMDHALADALDPFLLSRWTNISSSSLTK